MTVLCANAAEVSTRPTLVLSGTSVRLDVDLAGGSLGSFRFLEQNLNPLHWATPGPGERAPRGFGHFLCLDRWGPPSDAEGARGMPYHGEAAQVVWQVEQAPVVHGAWIEARLSARLPLAGLSVQRTLRLSPPGAVVLVRETVRNENALGRLWNAVQHPTIGPPFLDETTLVDCNGRRGFAQGGTLPQPEEPSAFWPRALNREGLSVDLRRLQKDPQPNVVSYVIDEAHGWVTAATPQRELLLGYVWKTRDYPWVSHWRDVRDGRPAARGLEFGTTGLHQPYPILLQKVRIWERPLFEYLDAGESVSKSYAMFLCRIPTDFRGVDTLRVEQGVFVLRERAVPDSTPREFRVDAAAVWDR